MTGLKRKHEQEKIVVPPALKDFISQKMKSFGCVAHDEAHCYRVANIAMQIAEEEEGADPKLTFVAGLLHDVLDAKLQDDGEIQSAETCLKDLLLLEKGFMSESDIEKLFIIVKAVGYKNVIKHGYNPFSLPAEYRCVQDADLLDGIGAIGVARCFAFSGKKNRKLFGMSRAASTSISHEDYMKAQSSTTDSAVDHFFDKLLTIEKWLSTKRGKKMGQERNVFMATFLKHLHCELADGGDETSSSLDKSVDYMMQNNGGPIEGEIASTVSKH